MAKTKKINEAMKKLLNEEFRTKELSFDLDAKIVIFSDFHRGKGPNIGSESSSDKDDFRISYKTYKRALDYYYGKGYTIFLLGDIEELWEVKNPYSIYNAYSDIYIKEKQFIDENRYYRCFGNHDMLWDDPESREDYFEEMKLSGVVPKEAFKLNFNNNSDNIGSFLLTHGHQGSFDDDFATKFKKGFVMGVWGPMQAAINIYTNVSPSKSWRINKKLSKSMALWSKENDMPLIFGHTHAPVFRGEYYKNRRSILDYDYTKIFNTGCCSYKNGSITGIEFSDKKIKLIEWEQKNNIVNSLLKDDEYNILKKESLTEVLNS